jgi:hypothetical protein
VDRDRSSWRPRTDGGPTDTDFTHNCDTEGGSSGAPIFTEQGALVGIHHLGFDKLSDGTCDKKNKGVHIGGILDHLKNTKRPLYDEIMEGVKP